MLTYCGITPVAGSIDDVYFAEARLILECRKLYFTDIYSEKDYHRMFVGET